MLAVSPIFEGEFRVNGDIGPAKTVYRAGIGCPDLLARGEFLVWGCHSLPAPKFERRSNEARGVELFFLGRKRRPSYSSISVPVGVPFSEPICWLEGVPILKVNLGGRAMLPRQQRFTGRDPDVPF